MRRILLAALIASAATLPAAAQTAPAGGYDAILTLGGGGRYQPSWDGAKDYTLVPFPIVGLKFLRSPFSGEATSDTGFGIRPAFRMLDKRSFKPGDVLFGLDKVDLAVELGVEVDYTDTWFRVFAAARQGFGGHTGQILDLGVDGIWHATKDLTFAAGPRLSFASAKYMDTYFGVTAAESLATGLAAYKPGGGYRGAGLGGTATWDLGNNWFVRADASWTHLSDDAASSPIVKADGSRDQFTVGLGAAYRFGVNWR
ncbi:MipA/OmpV family protein [Pinisolibacter sp.]|uniref:MipA/OmpV family protein n=1 Tax=Pinisolibacter sp. TaxID=2172024 RepID=UPI002FDE8B3D